MNKISRVVKGLALLAVTLIFITSCGAIDDAPDADQNVGSGTALADEFDQFVAEMVDESQIPGTAVALIQNGEVVLLKGYGFRDLENQLPATPDTLFHIASTQKSMTAMLVATLVDDGIVNWDTPLVEITLDFALGSGGESITLRHLLSMSSGIPDSAEDDFYDQGYEESATSIWPLLADTDPLGAPGEVFSYSNISSSMAGYAAVLALEPDAADLDVAYGELFFERVVRPIGMESAAFSVVEASQSRNYGKSYILDGNDFVEAEREDIDGDTLTPSGVIKASAAEMALYIQTQLNEGMAPNGTRIVSAENMRAMLEPQIEDDDEAYALGWGVAEYEGVILNFHEGSYDNYESVIGFVPELGIGFVVLTNSIDAAVDLIAEAPWFVVETALDLR
ncbi:MAG: serine hydrolase domain-containing protein [Chloroflexota bacterium]